jgi:hypothetical protein
MRPLDYVLDEDDEPDPDGPACVKCLGPTGRVPILFWRTDDDGHVTGHWAICDGCFRKALAAGGMGLRHPQP